jgi:hypothetical protein
MSFEEETGRGTLTHASGCAGTSGEIVIMRLQVVTLIWMVVECALALFSAVGLTVMGNSVSLKGRASPWLSPVRALD